MTPRQGLFPARGPRVQCSSSSSPSRGRRISASLPPPHCERRGCHKAEMTPRRAAAAAGNVDDRSGAFAAARNNGLRSVALYGPLLDTACGGHDATAGIDHRPSRCRASECCCFGHEASRCCRVVRPFPHLIVRRLKVNLRASTAFVCFIAGPSTIFIMEKILK